MSQEYRPGDTAATTARIGALLAVLGPHDEALYLSPELAEVLGAHFATLPTAPFWTVLKEHGAQRTGANRRDVALQSALVQLQLVLGTAHPALMTRVQVAGLSICSFRLQNGQLPVQLGGQQQLDEPELSPEQLAQLLYQLPVATIGVGLAGQLLYANAQAIRNAQMIEGVHQSFLGLNDVEYSALRGQDLERARKRTENLQLAVSGRQRVSWVDQIQLPGQPPEYWRRTYAPIYDERGDLSLISGSGIDVTAELHRHAELELLSHVAQNNLEAVLVVDIAASGSSTDRAGTDVGDSRVIFANRVAERLLGGGKRRTLTGHTLMEIAAPLMGESELQRLRPLLLAGRGTSAPVTLAQGTPSERCLQLSVAHGGMATTGGRSSHLCLTIRDVTALTRARQLEEGRSRALQLSLAGAPLPEVLTELVRTLEGQLPGLVGAVLLLRGERLYFGSTPRLSAAQLGLKDGAASLPGQGPSALAAQLGEPVIASDYAHDSRFAEGPDVAERFGIRSAWSVPFSGKHGQVLGTFAVYGFRPRSPRPQQLAVLRQLADLSALLTESRESSERLEQVAYHDPLTGLPNRSAFMQGLEDRLQGAPSSSPTPGLGQNPQRQDPQHQNPHHRGTQSQRTAVALIDLTGFRAINETYGQPTGNRLLQQVAIRLQDCLTPPDTAGQAKRLGTANPMLAGPLLANPLLTGPLLARLGGDEFGLMLPLSADLWAGTAPPSDPSGLLNLGERLLSAVSAPLHIDGQEVQLRASIGWSLYPELAGDALTLLNQADTAMYTARQEGASQRLYSQHGSAWSLSPTTIRAALEQALDQGQLHLAYQPLVSADGSVRSFEVLLRWTHPQYGNIGPDQFIPIAEMSGLIRHIGVWVLDQAAVSALQWPESVLVSVNISGRQFEHPGFAAEVQGVLERSGLDPARLELELTESALMVGNAQVIQTLQALRALGVRVALDDYGVGYSNLMRLHTLPINTIKIDRSFVAGLLPEQSAGAPGERVGAAPLNASAAIIRSVVGLAHDLGLEVVAEGIETQLQLQAVLELGCDAVQGYLNGRPTPAQGALAWLQARANQNS
jgi:predicted signal transduction protein with EAL and GGDEF domain/PAS domain-containing protein